MATTEQGKEFLKKGKAYLRDGAVSKAWECFDKGLALEPEDDELKIFRHGFRFFDAEDYMRRHPTMEPFEREFLQLYTDADNRRHYFLRFLDGSVYRKNPQSSYKDKLVSRKDYVPDADRCDACLEILGELPNVTIYAADAPGGLRSAAQAEYLFSRDRKKKFGPGFYVTRYYPAEKSSLFVNKKTLFGYREVREPVFFPETRACPLDIIAGTYDLRSRMNFRFYGEEYPPEFRVSPNPAIAALIRRYYPKK